MSDEKKEAKNKGREERTRERDYTEDINKRARKKL